MAKTEQFIDAQGKEITRQLSQDALQAIRYAQELQGALNVLQGLGYSRYPSGDMSMFSTGESYPEGTYGELRVFSSASNVIGGVRDKRGLENGVGFQFGANRTPGRRGLAREAFSIAETGLSRYFGDFAIHGPYALIVRDFNGRLEPDSDGHFDHAQSARTRDFIAVAMHADGLTIATGSHRSDPPGDLHHIEPSVDHLETLPAPAIMHLMPYEANSFINFRSALTRAAARVPLKKPEPVSVS